MSAREWSGADRTQSNEIKGYRLAQPALNKKDKKRASEPTRGTTHTAEQVEWASSRLTGHGKGSAQAVDRAPDRSKPGTPNAAHHATPCHGGRRTQLGPWAVVVAARGAVVKH